MDASDTQSEDSFTSIPDEEDVDAPTFADASEIEQADPLAPVESVQQQTSVPTALSDEGEPAQLEDASAGPARSAEAEPEQQEEALSSFAPMVDLDPVQQQHQAASTGLAPDAPGAHTDLVQQQEASASPALSPEEEHALLSTAEAFKAEGNMLYSAGQLAEAKDKYRLALEAAPPDAKQRSVYFANLAACELKEENWAAAAEACTAALQVDPDYIKALMRRCMAFEELDDFDHALTDAQQVARLDPTNVWAPPAVAQLTAKVTAKQEALKDEMLGKLKDLGNTILGKFGMSLDNFKAEKDPSSGSYSIKFEK